MKLKRYNDSYMISADMEVRAMLARTMMQKKAMATAMMEANLETGAWMLSEYVAS